MWQQGRKRKPGRQKRKLQRGTEINLGNREQNQTGKGEAWKRKSNIRSGRAKPGKERESLEVGEQNLENKDQKFAGEHSL